ncbi:unnamed protein product [Blepharisma stoltei]|uniref:Uncharacterized protein n=1 Tax=Blepharisma stoltei TaxID=1481888 RepID=A0AAU9IJU1_9CILI|nr:unnamed protein product [Blepharisma stoltei]
MSELFDINRGQLQKIFDSHQQNKELGFNDILKFCSSARIFPDLLTSQSIRKIVIYSSGVPIGTESSAKLNYLQFEKLLKLIAQQCFKSRKGGNDEYQLFFSHIKNSCHIRYRVDFETIAPVKKTSKSLIEKKIPKLNFEHFVGDQDSKSNAAALFRPSTTRNSKSSLFMFGDSPSKLSLLSEKLKKFHEASSPKVRNSSLSKKVPADKTFGRSLTRPSPKPPLTDRMRKNNGSSFVYSESPSPVPLKQVKDIFSKFKMQCEKTFQVKKPTKILFTDIQRMMEIREKRKMRMAQVRLSFNLWKCLTKLM